MRTQVNAAPGPSPAESPGLPGSPQKGSRLSRSLPCPSALASVAEVHSTQAQQEPWPPSLMDGACGDDARLWAGGCFPAPEPPRPAWPSSQILCSRGQNASAPLQHICEQLSANLKNKNPQPKETTGWDGMAQ